MAEAAQRTEKSEKSEPETVATPVPPFRLRPRAVPKLQNQMLGLVLGSLVLLVFVTVIALTLVFHFAEAHHAIAAQ